MFHSLLFVTVPTKSRSRLWPLSEFELVFVDLLLTKFLLQPAEIITTENRLCMMNFINFAIAQRALLPRRRRQYTEQSPRPRHDYGRGFFLDDPILEREDEEAAVSREDATRQSEMHDSSSDIDVQERTHPEQERNVPELARTNSSVTASRNSEPLTANPKTPKHPDDVIRDDDQDEELHGDYRRGQPAGSYLDGEDRPDKRFRTPRKQHEDMNDSEDEEYSPQAVGQSIMMTSDLVAKVEQAIIAQRSHLAFEVWEEKQNDEMMRNEMLVQKEIHLKEDKLEEYREGGSRVAALHPEFVEQEMIDLQTDIKVLRRMTRTFQMREQILDNKMSSHAKYVRQAQSAVISAIEDAFAALNLSIEHKVSVPLIEKYDIGEDFERIWTKMHPRRQSMSDWVEVENGEYVPRARAEVGEQEGRWVPPEEIEGLVSWYFGARNTLVTAQNWWDSRDERRKQEWNDHCTAESNGEETRDASRGAFDMRWVDEELTAEGWLEMSKTHSGTMEKNMALVGLDLDAAQKCGSKAEFDSLPVKYVSGEEGSEWGGSESDDVESKGVELDGPESDMPEFET